eukprot:TRINITY_DN18389_c0_g1_i2.p1 TRINITY_DN18389_c0_g1~~TRINITY_DN18389_c0_g1_i2.p1  ORF type:complete len:320 (+),score=58.56 TRINITY_DN18389_c0_g1_i2:161-1120(+)
MCIRDRYQRRVRGRKSATMSSWRDAASDSDITQALGVTFQQLGIHPMVVNNSTASCRAFRNLSVEYDLSSYDKLTCDEVSAIASGSASIVGASLTQVSREDLQKLVPQIPLLRRLELTYSDALTDFSFIQSLPCVSELVIQSSTGLTSLPENLNLYTLNLWGCCKLLDISALQHCYLASLDLGDCKMLSDITPLASCRHLKVLSLANDIMIRDLSPLSRCFRLKQLNVSGLKKAAGCKFLQNKEKLRVLNAYNCQSLFAADGLSELASCPELVELNFGYIPNLNLMPLKPLKYLRRVNLRGCKHTENEDEGLAPHVSRV